MTTATSSQDHALRFGVFELDLQTGELRKSGHKIALRPQASRVLAMLATRPDQLVTREELKEEIWGHETFVDFENGLNLCIRQIRAALNDDADTPRYIETLPRRGYRFIAPVKDSNGSAPALAAQTVSPKPRYRRAALFLIAGLGLLSIALTVFIRMRSSAGDESRIRSIAVLPLTNLTGDAEQEYLADGMTEELITDLAKVGSLRVISHTSVMHYKGTKKTLPQIARELNVDAVVEGSVQRSGQQLKVTAQLIRAPADQHLWAEEYERDARDVLTMETEVARNITDQIQVKLTPQEKNLLAGGNPVTPESHEAYLHGLYELRKLTPDSLEAAIQDFQQALAVDPKNALAYAGLADAYSSQSPGIKAPIAVMPLAKAAAVRALELDENLADAHTSLGNVKFYFDWDWSGAEREFRRALELNPNLASAHAGYASYWWTLGRGDEAIREVKRAQELDPLVALPRGDLAWILFNLRRYQEALQTGPVGGPVHGPALALSYAELGRREEAVAAADRALESEARPTPVTLAQVAAAYALAGRADKARKLLRTVEEQAAQRYVCSFNLAALYAVLGESEKAFNSLDNAYRDRSD